MNFIAKEIYYPVFHDHRGYYRPLCKASDFPEIQWQECDISVSHRGALRGIHGDAKTWKLVSCLQGEIFHVCVNDQGRHESRILSAYNHAVLIPPGVGNGIQIISDTAIFHYVQSELYPQPQFTWPWDGFGIDWPILPPILSERDLQASKGFRP